MRAEEYRRPRDPQTIAVSSPGESVIHQQTAGPSAADRHSLIQTQKGGPDGPFSGRAPARPRTAKSPARRAGSQTQADERKARTRQLIQAGGLIDKAGLLELEPNALYGALLSLRDSASDPEQLRQWAALGGRAFAREARLAEEGKEAIVLAFPAALDRDATTALRGIGFRFNKFLQHWEGLARFDEAEALAREYGGTVRRVTNAEAPALGSSSPLPATDRAAE